MQLGSLFWIMVDSLAQRRALPFLHKIFLAKVQYLKSHLQQTRGADNSITTFRGFTTQIALTSGPSALMVSPVVRKTTLIAVTGRVMIVFLAR